MMKKITFTMSVIYDEENTHTNNPLDSIELDLINSEEIKSWDVENVEIEDIEVEYDDEKEYTYGNNED